MPLVPVTCQQRRRCHLQPLRQLLNGDQRGCSISRSSSCDLCEVCRRTVATGCATLFFRIARRGRRRRNSSCRQRLSLAKDKKSITAGHRHERMTDRGLPFCLCIFSVSRCFHFFSVYIHLFLAFSQSLSHIVSCPAIFPEQKNSPAVESYLPMLSSHLTFRLELTTRSTSVDHSEVFCSLPLLCGGHPDAITVANKSAFASSRRNFGYYVQSNGIGPSGQKYASHQVKTPFQRGRIER